MYTHLATSQALAQCSKQYSSNSSNNKEINPWLNKNPLLYLQLLQWCHLTHAFLPYHILPHVSPSPRSQAYTARRHYKEQSCSHPTEESLSSFGRAKVSICIMKCYKGFSCLIGFTPKFSFGFSETGTGTDARPALSDQAWVLCGQVKRS